MRALLGRLASLPRQSRLALGEGRDFPSSAIVSERIGRAHQYKERIKGPQLLHASALQHGSVGSSHPRKSCFGGQRLQSFEDGWREVARPKLVLHLPCTSAPAAAACISTSSQQSAQAGLKQGQIGTSRKLAIASVSPNLLAEPYKGEPPKLPWKAYLGRAGWKERRKRFLNGIKSLYTLAKCKKKLERFDLGVFKAEALQIYMDVNRMIAEGDYNGLRHIVTPGEMTNIKRQLKARDAGGWKRVDWSLVEVSPAKRLEILCGRLLAIDPKDEEQMFAQLTVRIRSVHSFAAYNSRQQLVAGSPGARIPVQDVWVFEHSFKKAVNSKWRVAGRLGGVPPTAAPVSWRDQLARLFSRKRDKPDRQTIAAA